MLAGAFPECDYVVVPLPPMQCRSRYAEALFQIGWPCKLTRPVFNSQAIALQISRF